MKKIILALLLVSIHSHAYALMLDDDMLPGNSNEMRSMLKDHMEIEALEGASTVDPNIDMNENAFYTKLSLQDRSIYAGLNAYQRAFVLRVANMSLRIQISGQNESQYMTQSKLMPRDTPQQIMDEHDNMQENR